MIIQRVNMFFVLSVENNTGQTSYKQYYLSRVEIKYYNGMIDGQNFFSQPVQNNLRTHGNI